MQFGSTDKKKQSTHCPCVKILILNREIDVEHFAFTSGKFYVYDRMTLAFDGTDCLYTVGSDKVEAKPCMWGAHQ